MSLTKRGNIFWLDERISGRRIRSSLRTGDRREAQRRAEQIRARHLNGESSSRLSEAARRWFEEGSVDWRPRTRKQYRAVSNKIIRLLGDPSVEDVDEDMLRRYQRALREQNGSARTVNIHLRVLCAILTTAGADLKQPKRLREPKTLADPLDPEEIQRLLQHARGGRLYPVLVLGLLCGLRRGELVHIRWRDVAGGKIALREHDAWVPKHGHARAIRVSATLAAWFETHRIWVEGRIGRPVGPDDPVCPFLSKRDTRRHGGFWDVENLGNELARLFDATGVSRHNHTAHRLRDSFASLAASSGKSVRAIQELLGHEALATTENYLRSLGSDHQDVVDAVGQRLAKNVLGADEVRP